MNCPGIFSSVLLLAALGPGAIAFSQTPPPTNAKSQVETAPEAATPVPNTYSATAYDAERDKIWNSPRMLRARAWVQEYCQRSAKISPEEASQYLAELERLTPIQMKLWLLKFDEEQEQIDRQQAAFDQAREASVAHARSINEATEQAYSRISQGDLEAVIAQRELVAKEQAARQMYAQRADNSAAAATSSLQPDYRALYPPFYGGNPGMGYPGVIHFHTHTR